MNANYFFYFLAIFYLYLTKSFTVELNFLEMMILLIPELEWHIYALLIIQLAYTCIW